MAHSASYSSITYGSVAYSVAYSWFSRRYSHDLGFLPFFPLLKGKYRAMRFAKEDTTNPTYNKTS